MLVLAPHPDDESIATGGLLQVAIAAGAQLRVVVLTDGDNNPWPQRWVEKRWRIDAAGRARWGERRRAEAREAMRMLGVSAEQMRFFGLPDTGLTDLLMRAQPQVIDALREEFEDFTPTILVMPALSDRHPDHSAAHILAQVALANCACEMPRILTFGVHGNTPDDEGLSVALSVNQRDTKRAAILAHTSQMQLSSRRFLGYAKLDEEYQAVIPVPIPSQRHPLRLQWDSRSTELCIRIDARISGGDLRRLRLFVVLESALGSGRWMIKPGSPDEATNAISAIDGDIVGSAHWRGDAAGLEGRISLALGETITQGYVKLARPKPGWRVFDVTGWQTFGIPNESPKQPERH